MTKIRQKKIKIELFKEQETYTIYNGSMLDMLEVIQPNSIDSIVCDPPYELNFMNKGWDNCGISFNPDTWKKCYEALKPGGYLLAFGGSRTFHRIAVAIEDAGFEIRDTIMWLYGSGFPKSMNIGLAIDKKNDIKSEIIASYERYNEPSGIVNIGQGERKKVIHKVKKASNEWQGWGTALKPAYEPIIVARKPIEGTVVENVMKWGVGGLNIDGCRIEGEPIQVNVSFKKEIQSEGWGTKRANTELQNQGRFPANVIHDGSEEVEGLFPHTKSGKMLPKHKRTTDQSPNGIYGKFDVNHPLSETYGDSGSAARFFYTAKASKKDRDEGLEAFEATEGHAKGNGLDRVCEFCGTPQLKAELCKCPVKSWIAKPKKNTHPTVKPCELMQYLVRLVAPKGATILDPFMGSGSTGKAVMFENRERNANYKFIGIDLEEKYCQIAIARIDYALNKFEYDYIKEKQEAEARGQASIFDFIEVN